MEVLTTETSDVVYVPIILAVVEGAKRMGLPARFAALAAVVIGVAIGVLTNVDIRAGALYGIMWGLSAAGLYSGVKAATVSK